MQNKWCSCNAAQAVLVNSCLSLSKASKAVRRVEVQETEKQMREWVIKCQCGEVSISAAGNPIVSSACYCSDCQAAGHEIEQLPDAPRLVSNDGGTLAVLFRKDRVKIVQGSNFLHEHRLTPDSPTRRVVATCCNSAMFLDYTKGFWLSIYTDRFASDAPALQMRTMVKERPKGVTLKNDVPNYESFSGKFMVKLMLAWASMGFRSPELGAMPTLAVKTSPRS